MADPLGIGLLGAAAAAAAAAISRHNSIPKEMAEMRKESQAAVDAAKQAHNDLSDAAGLPRSF